MTGLGRNDVRQKVGVEEHALHAMTQQVRHVPSQPLLLI